MQNIAQKILFGKLELLKQGKISIISEKNQTYEFGAQTEKFPEPIVIHIKNPLFYRTTLFGGSVGAAESYFLGYWTCQNLVQLFQIFLNNPKILKTVENKWVRFSSVFLSFWHQFNRNTLKGSRKNIFAHYDLGNDFFRLFLDTRLMYSSAIFPNPNSTLEAAAVYKLDHICQKLKLQPMDKIIEIGSGWGGFAIHAATYYGCEVVTTTISSAQYHYAKKLITEKKLDSKITLLKEDYRSLPQIFNQKSILFDKLVSIEMIEAIGHQYFKKFFGIANQLLKPNGEALIQAITIQDQEFERAKQEVDFIKRYIFPGSCIPSITSLASAMTKSSCLKLIHLEDIGRDYAKTLHLWRERFLAHQNEIKKMGFDEKFLRLWEYYFSYCEAGFLENYLGDVQMHCVKSGLIND